MLSIALCTFQGEKFLQQQLESLVKQTLLPDELVVCDDASSDNTLQILEEFEAKAPFSVRIYQNKERMGIQRNFSHALSDCRGDYIAFCDQDDVWLPHKLEYSMDVMHQLEQETGTDRPLLVHSDLIVVDRELNLIEHSMMKEQGLRNEVDMEKALCVLLVQNYVTGCTMLINRSLQEIAYPFPARIVMHDWWIALLASVCGQIGYVEDPMIYYRQHGENSIGMKKYISLDSIKKIFRVKENLNKILADIQQIRELKIRVEQRGISSIFLTECLNLLEKNDTWELFHKGIHKQPWTKNIIYYFLLMYRRYAGYENKKFGGQE